MNRWLEQQACTEPLSWLGGPQDAVVASGLRASLAREDRQLSSVIATAETVIGPLLGEAPAEVLDPRRLIEERGTGLLAVAHEGAANVRCIVDLDIVDTPDGRPPRLPEAGDEADAIEGVSIPRIRLARDVGPMEGALRVLNRLSRV